MVETPTSHAAQRLAYLARRAGHLLVVLLLLSGATFLMLELLPGNLVDSLLGDNARPEDIAVLERELGLDKPLHQRFGHWLANAAQGDLGRSPLSGEAVTEAIAHRLPVSLQLMIYAQILALAIALPLGLWAGYREGSAIDRAISSGAFGILAVPHFVLGLLLILLLAIWLRWFPATGYVPFGSDPWGSIRSMTLPSLTLALVEAPVYLRLLRSDLAATLREEFITVARAKGLPDWQVLLPPPPPPSPFP